MTKEADDKDLVAMMVLGSDRAFELLYLRYAGAVRRLGVDILRSPEAADDLVQDTFLRLWRQRARYSSAQGSVRTWLFTIARNRAIDALRARVGAASVIEAARELALSAAPQSDPLAQTILRDEVAWLHAELAHLPFAHRQTVVLAYGGGLTHEEVAQCTGVPLGTVKSRIRMSKQRMARRLEPGTSG